MPAKKKPDSPEKPVADLSPVPETKPPLQFRGWRKIACVAFLVAVGLGIELFTTRGLSANMTELLKWAGFSYLGANAIKGGLQGLRGGPPGPPG